MSTTPRTDAATYPADCLGKTLVVHRDCAAALEIELGEAEQEENAANHYLSRAEKAETELAAERARLDDLVADINDACITLASAKDDCDDYAMQNTAFKLTAVRDVLLQYIPNSAMKEASK
jgi:molecular chaperone GrpE (heat shock protein)